MWDFLLKLFDTSDFPARWHCGHWTRGHGWLHIISDLGVWSAYVAIPCVLIYFAWRKRTLPFRTLFLLFGAFILACGTTHLMEATIFWWPAYRLAGLIKLFTAVVSWATVISLIPIIPQALALRTPAELDAVIQERMRAEEELRQMQIDLEQRVADRTAELTRTNSALRQSEERYRVLVEALSQIVWITEADGRIVEDSPSWRAFTGQTYEEWKGNGWLNAVHPEDRVRAQEDWERAVTLRSQYRTEYRVLNAAGEYRSTEARGVPVLDPEGRIVEWIGVNVDVTEQRQAAAALQEAGRRKDQFLAMLGHELRNPLSGISGAVQVLGYVGSAEPEARAMQEIIERQTGHMVRMIDDLLEVSRISRGKIPIRLERLDLREQVRRTFEDVRPTLAASQLEATLELPAEPVWGAADPTRLGQVLVNLLQNAMKFTDPGGKVSLSLARRGDIAEIAVRDSGIGLSPELISRLFEPFTQGDGSLERSRGGLGLGLALVKGLVELQGGRVTATSAGSGKGAEFIVTLPLQLELPEENSDKDATALALSARRILMIEDQQDVSQPLRTLLEREGHRVEVATDGPQGLALASREPPDVVLCDIGLPGGMDGYSVARALRDQPATRKVLLIAITGYGQEEDRAQGIRVGFDHYLTKPVNHAHLRRLLAASTPREAPGNPR